MAQAGRRARWWITVLTLLFHAYFLGGYLNNGMASSIVNLTLALVETGHVTIDRYAGSSDHNSERGGHVYSGFAPGLSVVLIPVYGVVKATLAVVPASWLQWSEERLWAQMQRRHPQLPASEARTAVLLVVAAGTLGLAAPLLIAATFAYVAACQRLFPDVPGRLRPALHAFFAFGSLLVAYGSNFNHTVIAALLVWLATAPALGGRVGLGTAQLVAKGLVLGVVPTIDYPGALFAAMAAAYLVLAAPRQARLRVTVCLVAGAAPPVLACLAYHAAAFGHPLATAYSFRIRSLDHVFARGMAEKLPSWAKVRVALFSPYGSLLAYHPLFLPALAGAAGLARSTSDAARRRVWVLALGVLGANFLVYCSYPLQDGPGSSPHFAVRYTSYSVPFVALVAAALVERWRTWRPLGVAFPLACLVNGLPGWAFLVFGMPVDPQRGYLRLLRQVGPANYTFTKLHEAGLLASAGPAWLGAVLVALVLTAWWRQARTLAG